MMDDDENTNEKRSVVRCDKCSREVEFGERAFSVEDGFVGPRSFVPLAKELLFCGETCLSEFFSENGNSEPDDSESEQIPRHIP